MHVHTESEVISPKSNKLKSNLIHLAVALFAVLVFPMILTAITQPKVDEIRQSNPQFNNNSKIEYYKGRINKVKAEIQPENSQDLVLIQQLDVKPLEGPDKDEIFALETQVNKLSEAAKYKEGDTVVLIKVNSQEQQGRYFISERYRLDQVTLAIMFFVVLVLVLVGVRGVTALAGLVFSILALTNFLIPMILIGQNVVLITFVTGLFIMVVSLFLSHGFNKTILISLIASVITITLSTLFSIAVVYFTKLTGTGSEDAYQLQFSNATIGLNFQGLFLSAMIIGTLGVLDDITTSQASTVAEISRANPKLSISELYVRGLRVGREHIISLVNTLGLAYVSVALPLLMYYIIYNPQPLWVTFNSENIVEEIIRTIVGSSALLLAVPITTVLAAKFLRHDPKNDHHVEHKHQHDVELVKNHVNHFKGILSWFKKPTKNNSKTSNSKNSLALFDENEAKGNQKTDTIATNSSSKESKITTKIKKSEIKKNKVDKKLLSELQSDFDELNSTYHPSILLDNQGKMTEKDSLESVEAQKKLKIDTNSDFGDRPTQLDVKGNSKNNSAPSNSKKRIQL